MIQNIIHSKLGASSYERWGHCPGSVALSEGCEKTESEYAREGTLAHEIASDLLTGRQPKQKADDEMLEAVMVYVDFVKSLIKGYSEKDVWYRIEQRFDLTRYHPNLFGTADAVVYYYATKKLIVVDYKHGAGVPVNVTKNKQLMYYGLGAMQELKLPVSELELVIVQPRCYHQDGPIRTWCTPPMEPLAFLPDLIDDAIATEKPGAPLNPGDWCRWCPAQAKCPALREKALVSAKEVFGPTQPYSPETLAELLHRLPQIEAWAKSVREFAYQEASHGRVPPGWKLVQKRATRKWREGVDESKLASEFGLKPPECFEMKLKSPAQIEKLIPRNLAPTMESLVVKESSGMTLAPDSDPRIEIPAGPGQAFAKADMGALM